MGRNKKFTEETYQQIKDNNSKENPFDINIMVAIIRNNLE